MRNLWTAGKTGLLTAIAGLLLGATPAGAQEPGGGASMTLSPAYKMRFDAGADREAAVVFQQRAMTPVVWRVQAGGVFWGGDAGLVVGGGLGTRPFNNKQVEVAGDLSFVRFDGHNGMYVGLNGLYHFQTSDADVSPYAGAGIGIIKGGGDTEARFEIKGGLEFTSGRRPIRPEVRFVFTRYDTATVLLVGIGLSER